MALHLATDDSEVTRSAVVVNRAHLPTASEDADTGGPITTLPPEILKESATRLGWAGAIYATAYTIAYWIPFFVQRASQPDLSMWRAENFFALWSIALGASVFALTRRNAISPERSLDLGLAFAILGALGIALAEFWGGFPEIRSLIEYNGVPWESVWILILPLVAPNTPKRMLVASLAAASTGPLVVAYGVLVRGLPLPVPVLTAVTYFLFTTYVCAGIAYVGARIVYHYGVRLKKAREIGSYVLVDRIGEGGMGEVWIARHRMLARPSAIKLIRPELLGTDPHSRAMAIARFEREARATAALGSTHTVNVHDFGLTDEGAFFYVMELLDGMSLDTLVRKYEPVPPARAIHLLRQVCHSLGEAHSRGLIHRDVKPANIFTCRLGPDADFVKVLDFGLVKNVDRGDRPEITAVHLGAGTPAYMAPELAFGQAVIDGRADLYAVGCVGYWLLTGQMVFKAETSMATILAHVRNEPEPPSHKSKYPVPTALDEVILQCLAKKPSGRPPDAQTLDRMLAAIQTAGTWTTDDARRWWDEHHPVTKAEQPTTRGRV
ncbi:MAG TPA: serine/threonine-protein kinase [Vicinamibacterales bacterium]|nr:serine/threonine-protein kinase [Vicinamibacterales bacterium]